MAGVQSDLHHLLPHYEAPQQHPRLRGTHNNIRGANGDHSQGKSPTVYKSTNLICCPVSIRVESLKYN